MCFIKGLRPDVAGIVRATRAQWDEMIELIVLPFALRNTVFLRYLGLLFF